MTKRERAPLPLRIGVIIVGLFAAFFPMSLMVMVGERAPSPSPGVPTATARADSEAAPARSLADGNGEDVVPAEWAEVVPRERVQTAQPEPASTVTQSALTATATVVIDPVPATPVATSRAVETLAPKSINSYDPWPAYLWPVVECLIQRESGGRAWEVSPGGDVGLMQIGPANFVFLAERGITRAMLFDGPTNIRAGWLLYVWWEGVNGDGLTPWKSTRGGC